MPPLTFDIDASSPGDARAKAMHNALPGVYGPRKVEFTERNARSARIWAWPTGSGR